jgi:hypothetical protein
MVLTVVTMTRIAAARTGPSRMVLPRAMNGIAEMIECKQITRPFVPTIVPVIAIAVMAIAPAIVVGPVVMVRAVVVP